MSNDKSLTATPTPGFALAPYKAEPAHANGPTDTWMVTNKDGFNCLSFAQLPGAKFTNRECAETIAAHWNAASNWMAGATAEVDRLQRLINSPQTTDWIEAVKLEAAHQQERWGTKDDAGKTPADWFWLIGYLAGKALAAFIRGDREKGLHHIISTSAVLLNWHRHATGQITAMRPGIADPAH